MSYGRTPYYIWSNGEDVFFMGDDRQGDPFSATVPREALAQFIVSMASRGQAEIDEWLEQGKKLRPELNNYELVYCKKDV